MWNDDQIIRGCRKCKKRAQQMLYEKYAPILRGICMRYACDSAETSDLLQEGFIKIFSKIDQFKGAGSFEGWMKRIVVNNAISHYKKNKKHYHHAEFDSVPESNVIGDHENEPMDNDVDINDVSEKTIDYSIIEKADLSQEEMLEVLKEVPEHFRIVFNLHVVEGMPHKDISSELGIDTSTSRTRLLRAKKIVKKLVYTKCIEKVTK
jgi:RNA polymerase sigma-70 factor (ECF subfamily)